jgi:hypothetical protein
MDPSLFGEGIKFSSVLQGAFCIRALKLLIMDCFRRDTTSFRGAWLGDPVILASDDTGLPDPGGIVTATPALARNLSALARAEFTNISYRALAELGLETDTAAELAARAKANGDFLLELGGVLDQYRVWSLDGALNKAVGHPWRKAWNQARAKTQWWRPLSPIDWPL